MTYSPIPSYVGGIRILNMGKPMQGTISEFGKQDTITLLIFDY